MALRKASTVPVSSTLRGMPASAGQRSRRGVRELILRPLRRVVQLDLYAGGQAIVRARSVSAGRAVTRADASGSDGLILAPPLLRVPLVRPTERPRLVRRG